MYGKIFSSTFTGSMFGAGPDVIAVWAYIIANSISSTIELNPPLLAAVLGMPPERVERAIKILESPDPKSRNPKHDGRRLVHEGAFQYHVTSHTIYRNMRDEEGRRQYQRNWIKNKRANPVDKAVDKSRHVDTVDRSRPQSTQSESEARVRSKSQMGDLSAPSEPLVRPDPLTTAGLILLAKIVIGDRRPGLGLYKPGQWAAKAADSFLESIPPDKRTDATRDEIRAKMAAFAACEDPRLTKGTYSVQAFCDAYNALAVGPPAAAAPRISSVQASANKLNAVILERHRLREERLSREQSPKDPT